MDDQTHDDLATLVEQPDDLDGYTLERLADYLDAGRQPYDPGIESSPACRHALAALRRLQDVAADLLDDGDEEDVADEEAWVTRIMGHISLDAHAGADFPLTSDDPDVTLVMTEGALRALIRAVGDDQPGFLIGRVQFHGDLNRPATLLTIRVHVTVRHGIRIPPAVDLLRDEISATVHKHTDFQDLQIDITVQDLTVPTGRDGGGSE